MNIFSFNKMDNKFYITYNSIKEKAFCIHMPDKVIKLNREDKIYSCSPEYSKNSHNDCAMVSKSCIVNKPGPNSKREQIILF